MKSTALLLAILTTAIGVLTGRAGAAPVRFAIVGLVHDHARGCIPGVSCREDRQLVAIAEQNPELVKRYAQAYKLADGLFHADLESMLEKVRPQAVAAFTSTFDHRRVVEVCAARGIHVMMEKPLA